MTKEFYDVMKDILTYTPVAVLSMGGIYVLCNSIKNLRRVNRDVDKISDIDLEGKTAEELKEIYREAYKASVFLGRGKKRREKVDEILDKIEKLLVPVYRIEMLDSLNRISDKPKDLEPADLDSGNLSQTYADTRLKRLKG